MLAAAIYSDLFLHSNSLWDRAFSSDTASGCMLMCFVCDNTHVHRAVLMQYVSFFFLVFVLTLLSDDRCFLEMLGNPTWMTWIRPEKLYDYKWRCLFSRSSGHHDSSYSSKALRTEPDQDVHGPSSTLSATQRRHSHWFFIVVSFAMWHGMW